MAQRKKSAVDVAAIEARVRAELAREGVVKLASIKPADVRGGLVAKWQSEGLELTKAVVRRPILAQLADALAHGALVPVKSLGAHVRGARGPELKALVGAAVEAGIARRVQRGAADVLAGPEVPVLSVIELRALRDRLTGLSKSLEKVLKKPGLTLLASDAKEALADAVTSIEGRRAKADLRGGVDDVRPARSDSHEDAMLALLQAVDAVRDERTGLSFVPAVVGRLPPGLSGSAAVKLLLNAAERELLELRPEGGIGRLSPAELAVCPPGPHDTRLSWARRLAGGPT